MGSGTRGRSRRRPCLCRLCRRARPPPPPPLAPAPSRLLSRPLRSLPPPLGDLGGEEGLEQPRQERARPRRRAPDAAGAAAGRAPPPARHAPAAAAAAAAAAADGVAAVEDDGVEQQPAAPRPAAREVLRRERGRGRGRCRPRGWRERRRGGGARSLPPPSLFLSASLVDFLAFSFFSSSSFLFFFVVVNGLRAGPRRRLLLPRLPRPPPVLRGKEPCEGPVQDHGNGRLVREPPAVERAARVRHGAHRGVQAPEAEGVGAVLCGRGAGLVQEVEADRAAEVGEEDRRGAPNRLLASFTAAGGEGRHLPIAQGSQARLLDGQRGDGRESQTSDRMEFTVSPFPSERL